MDDEAYMRLAIHLAETTRGQTHPNPAVGAVVVSHGRVVGLGVHLKAGEAHAEVHALRMAGERAAGATIYVTLEPCAHTGRTPPCADLIIQKKLKRVVVASTDSNPLVAGKGIARMRAAGITVDTGLMRKEADAVNRFFFHAIRHHSPYVTLKIACSLDGKTATTAGESQWITGEAARRDGQKLREKHDAILVGIGTVAADNPRLTVRAHTEARQPIRIVLDTHLRIDEHALVLTDRSAPTWLITGNNFDREKAARISGGHVRIFNLSQEPIAIREMLAALWENGITSVLVEGGATVHGSFLEARAVNEVVAYVAPKLIGGIDALPAIGGKGMAQLADSVQLTIEHIEQMDDDLKIVASRGD
ncbi:bifunctional diaminohydroxyphosphoribosylaminopyrimidine deaminase/5-amino-6-(5-phosphoribosylamino)uracil reductase RibD [Sporolactobacillus mangiferae]|nr:bifunctional diaminohydroxyphosphoribosylaminopyrimidine deaminase/5-amino-6-(5-phosphoribosylamino)uracil reductase RibD [Sporolactobacillus mangiferae]